MPYQSNEGTEGKGREEKRTAFRKWALVELRGENFEAVIIIIIGSFSFFFFASPSLRDAILSDDCKQGAKACGPEAARGLRGRAWQAGPGPAPADDHAGR